MCIIAIAVDVHPAYPLIIAANRDEFYNRPTQPLGFWNENPEILAGRDLQSGGTWLGVTRTGKISAITNFREPASMPPSGKSRGLLVKDYLAGSMTAEEYLAAVEQKKDYYSGFNLIAGNVGHLWWYSNKSRGMLKLKPGIHALSNHLLNTPWPKVKTLKSKLGDLIKNNMIIEPYTILDLLYDRRTAPDDQLPDTGVGLERERMLSPVFVASPDYGTRSSSAILARASGRLVFCERTFSVDEGVAAPERARCFEIKLA